MFIPIRTDYRMRSRPWVNYALIAANVMVFFAGFNGGYPKTIEPLLLHPTMPQIHQFLSSIFLHGNFVHLLGNMLFLWVFGNAINDRFGHLGYLAYYLAGGVISSLGYILLSADVPALGASGAISAVAGAYLVLLPRVRVRLLVVFPLITTFEISSLYFLLFQFIWDLLLTLGTIGKGASSGGGIAYAAHSSGYIFGIAVAAILLVFRVLPRDDFDLLSLIKSGRRRGRYRRMVSRGFDPFSAREAKPGSPRWVRVKKTAAETPDSPAATELRLRGQIADACRRQDLQPAAEKYLRLVQIADEAVLSLQNQLDVANFLMSSQRHPAAADAYERFLKHYSTYDHLPDIHLMLGLLYGRYLHQYDRAQRMLNQAIKRLTDPQKLAMAKADLEAVRLRLPRRPK